MSEAGRGGASGPAMSIDACAAELLEAGAAARSIAAFTSRDPGFDMEKAYAVAERVHRARLARGERPIGRKIGFTNRNIWAEYGVYEPIWGFVYDATVVHAKDGRAELALGGFLEPRIEPEIVLQFARAPLLTGDADLEGAILGAIDWIAHGFEIVQTPFPGWKFRVEDTVAANGLHGRLVIGEPVAVADIPDCARRLREFRIALARDGTVQAVGGGANVLDSPLLAFAHLAEVLARLPQFGPVGAGEVVTTGTLTAALPVQAGERWRTRLDGIPLPGLEIAFR
jgi:2-oxo-3-hexenedioate decarboxylase